MIEKEVPKRVEKEVKKVEPIVQKKPELNVSPKKIPTANLPISRHRVISQAPIFKALIEIFELFNLVFVLSFFLSFQRVCQGLLRHSRKLKTSSQPVKQNNL